MRQKYIDETVGVWFEFGVHPESGNVDISDGNRDVFTDVPKDRATRLIALQAEFRDKLYAEYGVL